MKILNNFKTIIVFSFLATLLFGCQTAPYDYSALIASKPRSILVIPPMNNTVEVNAPYTFLSTISRPLAEKGYYVFPVAVIDTFMKENGLPTPEEMNAVPLDKIRENIGPDAILYVTIEEWGQKFEVFQSRAVTKAELRLIDARSGVVLWNATAVAQEASNDGGGGLAGAIVSAIVTQIAGHLTDRTPQLSAMGNFVAINHQSQGLLPGPYANPVDTDKTQGSNSQ